MDFVLAFYLVAVFELIRLDMSNLPHSNDAKQFNINFSINKIFAMNFSEHFCLIKLCRYLLHFSVTRVFDDSITHSRTGEPHSASLRKEKSQQNNNSDINYF